MYKIIFIPILALICYLSTALYSFHQVHKSIYYNDKSLIKEYVEWNQLRENFKNYLNIQLLKETQNNEDLKNLGGLSILITGVASKIVDNMLDTYVNSEGLSMLLGYRLLIIAAIAYLYYIHYCIIRYLIIIFMFMSYNYIMIYEFNLYNYLL